MSENLALTHNSIELYEQIFNNNNDPKNIERLNWMHENNPLKKRYFSVYLDTVLNRPAALYAVFPVIFKSFGKKVNAVQSIDTITDVNYRGMGLFKKLAIDCYNNAKNDGMAFVYGFPNDQSAPGFFKSLGWKPIAEVPFLVKPINIFYPLKYKLKKNIPFYINLNLGLKWLFSKNKAKYIAKDIIHFDEQYDALWDKYSATFKNCVERNAVYMNWRITNHPTEKYIVKSFSVANKLIAVFVLSIKEDKHNGKIGYIIDTIFDPDYSADMDYLFHHAIKKTFYAARADMILAWCFDHSQNYPLYSKNSFFKLPPRLQPIKLFFGACNFINKDDEQFFDKKNWYLSYCDSDTV
jgi:Acetyltransferase (GNAT) domain